MRILIFILIIIYIVQILKYKNLIYDRNNINQVIPQEDI